MPSENAIRRAVARLSLMKFFSGEPDTRGAIAEALNQICSTDEQLDRLSQHLPKVYHEWPGVYELRACACSMFPPADGVNADSGKYPEGIPTPAELKHPELVAIPPASRRLDLPLAEQAVAHRQLESGRVETRLMIEAAISPALLSELLAATSQAPPKQPRTIAEIEAELYAKHPVPAPKPKLSFEDQLSQVEADIKAKAVDE